MRSHFIYRALMVGSIIFCMSEVRDSRSATMRFVFPVLISVMIAMLFVSFYARLPPQLPFSISESDLPKPSRPNPIQVLSTLPRPT